jgi:hypothetical protein
MDLSLSLKLAVQVIKCEYLVVISNCENCIIFRDNFKTPCFSFVMSSK